MNRFAVHFVGSIVIQIGVFGLSAEAQAAAQAAPVEAREVTLYRDTWGVPHVYGNTMGEAAFGLGYAQAEDRLEDIFKNIRTATGAMAEAFGPQFAESDFIMKLLRNAESCEEYWKTAGADTKEYGDNYVLGVEAYLKDHPEKKPEYACELAGWHCMAVLRTMVLWWPLEAVKKELQNKGKNESKFASNSFAIAPSRSADGSAIVMTDPHMPTWTGMNVFYEARVHGSGRLWCGFWLVGTPIVAVGHNDKVAWAITTGGPDTSDVYMVQLNPENPMQYKYFGEWRDFEVREYIIPVKDADPLVKPALYTVYGPVMEPPDRKKGIAYTAAVPHLDRVDTLVQAAAMANARSCDEFYDAVSMFQMMGQNMTFADTQGNIQYLRNGCTPIRPEGYDWSAPVPGGIEATKWQGIHPVEDLIQLKNPPQGYFQNCNNNPETMLVGSPMTRDKYPDYIFNQNNYRGPRSIRLLDLLDADESVTREEAMDYTLDTYDILAERWQKALKSAVDNVGAERMKDPKFAGAVDTILAWDGRFEKDSAAAPIIRYWRMKCTKGKLKHSAIREDKPLGAEKQIKLLAHLSEALEEMKAKYGSLDVVWGDINLIGRSGKYFPCSGAEFTSNYPFIETETLFDVDTQWNETEKGSGRYVAKGGTATVMLSFLTPDGIESFSLINWGQSADPNSPHHIDQAEKLYAECKFKPTWTKKEDLMQHLESEKTLAIR